jgi:hypothetical protein
MPYEFVLTGVILAPLTSHLSQGRPIDLMNKALTWSLRPCWLPLLIPVSTKLYLVPVTDYSYAHTPPEQHEVQN